MCPSLAGGVWVCRRSTERQRWLQLIFVQSQQSTAQTQQFGTDRPTTTTDPYIWTSPCPRHLSSQLNRPFPVAVAARIINNVMTLLCGEVTTTTSKTDKLLNANL